MNGSTTSRMSRSQASSIKPMGDESLSYVRCAGLPMRAIHCALLVLLVGYCASACAGPLAKESRVEQGGLVVVFAVQCLNGAIEVKGNIENSTDAPIRIRSGSLPWEFDVLGSEFTAEADGVSLPRDRSTPILGRVGPITLQAHERQGGVVPIEKLFPSLHAVVAKQTVSIHWKYWTDVKTMKTGPTVFDGTITVPKEVCNH
jgi:hypothetical protein